MDGFVAFDSLRFTLRRIDGHTSVTQGLTGAGGALLQAATLFIHYIRKWFFGRTPRQAYTVTFLMPSVCHPAKVETAE